MSDFLSAARDAKAEKQGALLRALGGLPAEGKQEAADKPMPGFDGGARTTPPTPVTASECPSSAPHRRPDMAR